MIKTKISQRVISRLSEYRRALDDAANEGIENVFSHELATMCGVTSAQVRRDLMEAGVQGSPSKGYDVLKKQVIDEYLGFGKERKMVLVGIGHLGRALLDFFADKNPMLILAGAFDISPDKVDRVIHGVHCYHVNELKQKIEEIKPHMGIITVPKENAQEVALALAESGVSGILNFAPTKINVPDDVYVENLNLCTVFEKVAFFAGQNKKI